MLLSVLVGLGSGLAAVVLKKLIELIQHLLFGGNLAEVHWWLYIVLPGVGMLLSMLLVKYLVRDNISHGVTKVLLAISKNESHIRPHTIWSSIAASSLSTFCQSSTERSAEGSACCDFTVSAGR